MPAPPKLLKRIIGWPPIDVDTGVAIAKVSGTSYQLLFYLGTAGLNFYDAADISI